MSNISFFSIIQIQNHIGKEIAIQKYKNSIEPQPRYIYLPGCSFEGYISEDNLAVKEAPSIQMKENTIWKVYYNPFIELKYWYEVGIYKYQQRIKAFGVEHTQDS